MDKKKETKEYKDRWWKPLVNPPIIGYKNGNI